MSALRSHSSGLALRSVFQEAERYGWKFEARRLGPPKALCDSVRMVGAASDLLPEMPQRPEHAPKTETWS